MARFYLDADIPTPLALLLQSSGHQVETARQRRLSDAGDEKQLLTAAELDCILVSHNRGDFLLLHRAWRRWAQAWKVTPLPQHGGILIVPQVPASRFAWLVETVDRLIASGSSIADECYVLDMATGWQRQP